jgi:hypothetical protein
LLRAAPRCVFTGDRQRSSSQEVTMRHAVLALAGALAFVPATAPAHAEPFVGRAGSATATVQLRGTDGKAYEVHYTVTALVPQSGAATYSLDIAIAKCTDGACGTAKRYSTKLTSSQVTASDDMTSVDLHAKVLGTTLNVVWSSASDPGATTTPGVRVETAEVNFAFNGADEPADVRAAGWGASCRTQGTYESSYLVAPDGYVTDSGPAPSKSAPTQFATRGRKHATCLV